MDEWLASWRKHDERVHALMDGELAGWLRRLRIWAFGQCEFEAEVWRRVYEWHYREVVEYFEGRAQTLLLYKLCEREGWEPLCDFLEETIP